MKEKTIALIEAPKVLREAVKKRTSDPLHRLLEVKSVDYEEEQGGVYYIAIINFCDAVMITIEKPYWNAHVHENRVYVCDMERFMKLING